MAAKRPAISKFDEARRAAIASGALLYSIVIRPVKNESGRNTAGEHALITITDSTGGGFSFSTSSISSMTCSTGSIANCARSICWDITRVPTPPPGSDRHVQVDVKGDYTVRYRKEYFTPAAQ